MDSVGSTFTVGSTKYHLWDFSADKEEIMGFYKGLSNVIAERDLFYFCNTSPFVSALILCLVSSFVVWALSVINKKYSWVDKQWPIWPVGYAIHSIVQPWICNGVLPNARHIIMAVLITIWGVRLTYASYRKGYYKYDHEDYRWEYVKRYAPGILFALFNIVFIALYQNILILWFAAPIFVADRSPTTVMDYVLAAVFVILWLIEGVADQQQWKFQNKKHKLINEKAPLKGDFAKGFITSGLFKYSRHPNFFGEISMWWVIYLFSILATHRVINWTMPGAFMLMLIFQGSTKLTEFISGSKYPEYANYQKTTSRIIPWLPRRKIE